MIKRKLYRGVVVTVDFGEKVGSVQGGIRPALIVQNNVGNEHSSTLIVAKITSKMKKKLPTHVWLQLSKQSIILCEQLETIDKSQVIDVIKMVTPEKMKQVNYALLRSIFEIL